MCNQNSFETLLDFGCVPEVMDLDYPSLEITGIQPEAWEKIGMLKKRPLERMVRCRYCDTFVPFHVQESEDGIILRADCCDCGMYELFPEEKVVWRVDYTPVFQAARKTLNCAGEISEILPHALWSLGRAPICGQSREILACAGINSTYNDVIIKHLPEGKTPILLIFGDKILPHKLDGFSADRVFKISQLTRIRDGEICFDASHIHAQIATLAVLEEPKVKSPGKNSIIGDLIIKLKHEIREYMKGNYSALLQAERSNSEYIFPSLKQSDLAVMFDVPRVYVKRAMDQDLELRTLFDAANNRNSTMAYACKAIY